MKAKDEKGRKRFVGAFTGGFTAGYKNTVGSKEGFVPGTFKSSRGDKNKQKYSQNVMDYMDEEDIGQTIAGETIKAKDEYDTMGNKSTQHIKKGLGKHEFGEAPKELIVPVKTSIGYQILQNMGTQIKNDQAKPKQEVKSFDAMLKDRIKKKPKGVLISSSESDKQPSKTQIMQELAEEENDQVGDEGDDEIIGQDILKQIKKKKANRESLKVPEFKEGFGGLGYVEEQSQGFARIKQEGKDNDEETLFNKLFAQYSKASIGLIEKNDEEDEETKKQKNRISMGGNNDAQFGDSDDEMGFGGGDSKYSQYELDQFDEQAEALIKSTGVRSDKIMDQISKKTEVLNFKPRKENEEFNIPNDWDPYKRVKEYVNNPSKNKQDDPIEIKNTYLKRMMMNPAKRAEILGEKFTVSQSESLANPSQSQTLNDKIARIPDAIKKQILSVKTFVKASNSSTEGKTKLEAAFKGDKERIEKFKEFLQMKGSTFNPEISTKEELLEEIKEFEQHENMVYGGGPKKGSGGYQANLQTSEAQKQADLLKRIEDLKKNIEQSRSQRQVEYWLPDRMLCKRFNVPQPALKGEPTHDKGKKDDFTDKILPAFMQTKYGQGADASIQETIQQNRNMAYADRFSAPAKEFTSNKFTREAEFESQRQQPLEDDVSSLDEEERPPMELFESIFD